MTKHNKRKQVSVDLKDGEILALWSRARKGSVKAQRKLYSLVLAHPYRVPELIRREVGEGPSDLRALFGHKQKPQKPLSPWQRTVGAAGRYVVWTQGGLPTLGKRR